MKGNGRNNQKLKLFYLYQYLKENTWEEQGQLHGVTVKEIIAYLTSRGISAERKSIYTDIEALETAGIEIGREKVKGAICYCLLTREFELPEIKLLADVVQASRCLSKAKSEELVKKLGTLTSRQEAKQLQRDVQIMDRVKAETEKIFYTIDAVQSAIHNDCQIAFTYLAWTLRGNLMPRTPKSGEEQYVVSPWTVLVCNEAYYLVAYDAYAGMIKHYRMDKIFQTKLLPERKREGESAFFKHDLTTYARQAFRMYDGPQMRVTLRCHNSLVGVMYDEFGSDLTVIPEDDTHFRITVQAYAGATFWGWIFQFGELIQIVSPQEAVEIMRERLEKVGERYKK